MVEIPVAAVHDMIKTAIEFYSAWRCELIFFLIRIRHAIELAVFMSHTSLHHVRGKPYMKNGES